MAFCLNFEIMCSVCERDEVENIVQIDNKTAIFLDTILVNCFPQQIATEKIFDIISNKEVLDSAGIKQLPQARCLWYYSKSKQTTSLSLYLDTTELV